MLSHFSEYELLHRYLSITRPFKEQCLLQLEYDVYAHIVRLPDHYEDLLSWAEADSQGRRSTSEERVRFNIGLIHTLTGEGPRRITAFGMVLRGIGHGSKVSVIMFVEDKPG